MREVSIARFVPAPTDTGSSNAFEAAYAVFADNPLILLIFMILVIVWLLRWQYKTTFRRRHGPSLKREIDLYRKAIEGMTDRDVPPAEPEEEPAKLAPEFNVEGRRVN